VGGVAGAELAVVFAEGDVSHVVQAVFDAPASTLVGADLGGFGVGAGEA
jgi:hypothetical protein